MAIEKGARVGSYEILAFLNKGGMGEVYRAWDPRLEREVAIKMPGEKKLRDERAFLRFQQEAKVLASLSHPNILTIYDVVIESGNLFVVTELLKGETLRERIAQGSLPWNHSVEIGIALAEGLSAAHARGIIHRDLKPENVFLTQAGLIKILDFGLARVSPQEPSYLRQSRMDTSPALSQPGAVLGTLRSMAPEQINGQAVDARADLYALGCILYEMISGRFPFPDTNQATLIASILRDAPVEIENDKAPRLLIDLIFQCLEKDSAKRPASAHELAIAMRSSLTERQARLIPAVPKKRRIHPRSVAVLPIANVGSDTEDEYLMDGITESILNILSRHPDLKVTARSTVFRYKGKEVDPKEIGKTLGVGLLMTGRGSRRGDRLDIQAEVVKTSDGSQVWGQHFSKGISDVFSLQEEIAALITASLERKFAKTKRKLQPKRYAGNVEAYQLYLKGRYYWNKRVPEAYEKARRFFEQAIESDPTYAPAYSGIADCYNLMGFEGTGISDPKVVFPRAIRAATTALEIDDGIAEAHCSLAFAEWFYHYDWEAAADGFLRSIKLNPGYTPAHIWYADFLAGAARFEEALARIQIAENVDPLSPVVYAVRSMILYFCRNYPASLTEADKALELQPDYASAFFGKGRASLLEGRYDEAIEAMERALVLSGNHTRIKANVALVYAVAGKIVEAKQILQELSALSENGFLPGLTDIAFAYAALGEKDHAFHWLQKAYEARSASLMLLYPDPVIDSLRSDPRFDDLIHRLGLKF